MLVKAASRHGDLIPLVLEMPFLGRPEPCGGYVQPCRKAPGPQVLAGSDLGKCLTGGSPNEGRHPPDSWKGAFLTRAKGNEYRLRACCEFQIVGMGLPVSHRQIVGGGKFQAVAIGLSRIFRREISCLNGLQTELAA